MEYTALQEVVRLAKAGLPVLLVRDPKEPGRVRHQEYAELLDQLHRLPSCQSEKFSVQLTPLIEGDDLPDFWCRKDGDTYYVFVANPMTQTIEYPLEYCYAFTDKGSTRQITVNHHGKSERITITFKPMESLLLKIDKKGVQFIDLGFTPVEMNGYNLPAE